MVFTLEDLSFAHARALPPVLRGLSLKFPTGAITVVLGASGSGKSTLLNLLSLMLEAPPTSGQLFFESRDGTRHDYARLTPRRRAELRLRYFGIVPQEPYLFPHLSCLQNVALPLLLQGESAGRARQRVEELLRSVDSSGQLSQFGPTPAGRVAGGTRWRLAFLRALVHDPEVVFADQPLHHLDTANCRWAVDLLARWRAGELGPSNGRQRTLILTSQVHDLADCFVVLADGKAQGPLRREEVRLP
jgi:ABC-type lipoprotein export system ATPase subunit